MNLNLLNQRAYFDNYSIFNDKAILPDMIENQRKSFKNFLNNLGTLFEDNFPIISTNLKAKLDFVEYKIEHPKVGYDICKDYSITYAASMKVHFRLTLYDVEIVDGESKIKLKDTREQWVFFSDIPLMTDYSTFLINGCEHVVISQIHRSSGIFIDHDDGKSYVGHNKYIFSASLIPYRGSWLDLEFDSRDIIYFRIDKKRKMPVTTLLRGCGFGTKEILDKFYKSFKCNFSVDRDEQYAKIYFDKETFFTRDLFLIYLTLVRLKLC